MTIRTGDTTSMPIALAGPVSFRLTVVSSFIDPTASETVTITGVWDDTDAAVPNNPALSLESLRDAMQTLIDREPDDSVLVVPASLAEIALRFLDFAPVSGIAAPRYREHRRASDYHH